MALFAAVGGGAYAASKVDTDDLARNAVTAKKLAKGAVSTSKFKDSAVAPVAERLGNVTVTSSTFTVSSENNQGATVACPPGKQALSGGANTVSGQAAVTATRPDTGAGVGPGEGQGFSAWHGAITNFSNSGVPATVWVVCAD